MNEPKERPILFSGEMVRAILDGRKTVTRRVVKPQPPNIAQSFLTAADNSGDVKFFKGVVAHHVGLALTGWIKCPYGRPGDILYVKETWKPGAWREDGRVAIDYRASPEATNTPWLEIPEGSGKQFDELWLGWTDELLAAGSLPDDEGFHHWEPGESPLKWRPSIFMPRWASRLTLRVTAVKVERVQDITEEDAKAEGVENIPIGTATWSNRQSFSILWDSINVKRGYSWESNPFVWCVSFELVG